MESQGALELDSNETMHLLIEYYLESASSMSKYVTLYSRSASILERDIAYSASNEMFCVTLVSADDWICDDDEELEYALGFL